MVPGLDPRPGFERVKEVATFASGGLTSPVGASRVGTLPPGGRAATAPATKMTVADFLKKADETPPGGKQTATPPSFSGGDMVHLLYALLRHDPMAIVQFLGKK